jgi:hypothetical protein
MAARALASAARPREPAARKEWRLARRATGGPFDSSNRKLDGAPGDYLGVPILGDAELYLSDHSPATIKPTEQKSSRFVTRTAVGL